MSAPLAESSSVGSYSSHIQDVTSSYGALVHIVIIFDMLHYHLALVHIVIIFDMSLLRSMNYRQENQWTVAGLVVLLTILKIRSKLQFEPEPSENLKSN